jgi:glycosyltransferase involved in cell wall biosynthesis
VQEKAIDIIVAEHSYAGWIAYQVQKRTGKPFIIHSHNIESIRFSGMKKWWWKFYHRYEGWIHRKAAYNFFISGEDMDFAIKTFGLSPTKCMVVTYGIERLVQHTDKAALKNQLNFPKEKVMLLFNGTLDYTPNYEAVVDRIEKVEPLLRKKIASFQIMITGNRAPKELIQKMLAAENLLYLGYVPDVDLYYRAADLFLNPVINNSGVKTKLIEAIGNNCTSVSTESGASGLNRSVCGDKVIVVADEDWDAFADSILTALSKEAADTPEAFYQYYEWQNIAKKLRIK